jgi:Cysteine-rich CPCC
VVARVTMAGVEKFVNVEGAPGGGPYACPCCGFVTLPERSGYEICPVCFWEDDGQDDHDADEVRGGPNGMLSLTAARANFRAMGACDDRCQRFVRDPMPAERPG